MNAHSHAAVRPSSVEVRSTGASAYRCQIVVPGWGARWSRAGARGQGAFVVVAPPVGQHRAGTCRRAAATTSLWSANVLEPTLPHLSCTARHSRVFASQARNGWKP
jgi:hypothetical protein